MVGFTKTLKNFFAKRFTYMHQFVFAKRYTNVHASVFFRNCFSSDLICDVA